MRGRVALYKSQPEGLYRIHWMTGSGSLGSKWNWRLRRKNKIHAKVIGPVGRRRIPGTEVSGVQKNERNLG